MKKNITGQNIPFAMVNTDGTAGTGLTVSVFVTIDGGTQAAGVGVVTEKANGGYNYAPTQAETNGDVIQFLFTATGAVNSDFTVYTDAHFDPAVDQVDADVVAVGGDVAAPANLALMYNGTGYTDDTAPASRSQLSQITITGSAVNVVSRPSPDGFVLTAGSELNTEDSTWALDNVRHELSDSAGVLDCYYKFSLGGDAVPSTVTITGVFNGGNDDFGIFANAGSSTVPDWVQVGTLEGTNSGVNVTHTFNLFADQIVTDLTGEVWVRIFSNALSTSSFDVDQIFVSKAVVNRSVGYALGAIWVDTNGSNVGTENYVDGVADNPVSTWAAALTLSSQLGLKRFFITPGSSVILTGNSDGYSIDAFGATVDINGQSLSGAAIHGCDLVGNDSGSNLISTRYESCSLVNHTLGSHCLHKCTIQGNITLAEASDYLWDFSSSFVAGNGTPQVTFPLGNAFFNLRHYSGGIQVNGMAAGDTMSLEGWGQCIIDATCTGGEMAIRGNIGPLTDNAAGAVTVTQVARIATDGDPLPVTGGGGSGATAQEVWEYATRSLTDKSGFDLAADQSAVTIGTVNLMAGTIGTLDALDTALDAQHVATQAAIAALNDISALQVNAEVVDALNTDTYAEPGQETPPATASLAYKVSLSYKYLINRKEQTSTTFSVYNNAGTVVDQKSSASDDGTTVTKTNIVAGP